MLAYSCLWKECKRYYFSEMMRLHTDLKKKILILRDETERPEVLDCGCGVLVGSDINKIKKEFYKELNSTNDNKFINPFGRGNSSKKIINKMIKIN